MAKIKFQSCAPNIYALIVRDAAGRHINGTGSRGDLAYSMKLAHSLLRIDRTGAASVDIYAYGPDIRWQDHEPLATVTLDTDLEVLQ